MSNLREEKEQLYAVIDAIDAKDTEALTKLLEDGFDPNKPPADPNKVPVLCFAARKGYVPIVKVLVEHGADLGVSNGIGITPLMEAVSKKSKARVKMIKYLLDSGADVNQLTTRDDDVRIALNFAAQDNFVEAAKLLVERGSQIDVGVSDTNFDDPTPIYTPLHMAVMYNHPEMVALLLGAGANPNVGKDRKSYNENPLDIAARKGFKEAVELLLKAGAKAEEPFLAPATMKKLARMKLDV